MQNSGWKLFSFPLLSRLSESSKISGEDSAKVSTFELCSPKEQIERNIRKNLKLSDELYIVASDEIAKRKVIQVALKVMFRLRKEKPNRALRVRIGTIDELKSKKFKNWFEVSNR